jgi:hypothetical protein
VYCLDQGSRTRNTENLIPDSQHCCIACYSVLRECLSLRISCLTKVFRRFIRYRITSIYDSLYFMETHFLITEGNSAYHFDADPDLDLYLMPIQIRIFIWCGCGSGSTVGYQNYAWKGPKFSNIFTKKYELEITKLLITMVYIIKILKSAIFWHCPLKGRRSRYACKCGGRRGLQRQDTIRQQLGPPTQ